ncbi:TetR/AcrR family transcriptional regulator [Streptomyces sp. NPDC002004]
MSETDEPGLRERKKDQTRRALRECAAKLFAEHGFAGTTIADIAACANVSERTFFRYFDSKEALLLPDGIELFAHVERALAERPADEDPLQAVTQALLDAVKPFAGTSLTALTRPLEGTESLVASRLVLAFGEFEERLGLLIEKRLPSGTPDADLHAAVIAGAALSAVRAVLRTLRNRRRSGREEPVPPPLLPAAFAILSRIGTPRP